MGRNKVIYAFYKDQTKKFSCHKHGELQAFKLALAWRAKQKLGGYYGKP